MITLFVLVNRDLKDELEELLIFATHLPKAYLGARISHFHVSGYSDQIKLDYSQNSQH